MHRRWLRKEDGRSASLRDIILGRRLKEREAIRVKTTKRHKRVVIIKKTICV